MLDLSILSVLSKTFRSWIQEVVHYTRRLSAERKAGQKPGKQSVDLTESILDETLDRLRGDNIDDLWWRNILNRIGQRYITPDFLQEPELQEWLAGAQNAKDLKTFVKTRIVLGREDDSEIRAQLVQSYSDQTGQTSDSAAEAIDIIVGILCAGYLASTSREQRALTGIVQSLPRQIEQGFDLLKSELSTRIYDPITEQSHTDHAKQELSKIRTLRVFNPAEAQQDIQRLIQRIINDDLSATKPSVKAEILLWGARLCALDKQTLALAQGFRDELKQIEPDMDLSIVEALFLEAQGNVDAALHILRECEDSDSRSVLFSMLDRTQGEQKALAWFEKQENKDDQDFFTGVGWLNLAISLAKVGKWEEAANKLFRLESSWSDVPTLAFVEGMINAAMLLPEDCREIALDTIPAYPGITLSLGEKAKNYHARAHTCFEYSDQTLKEIANQKLLRSIKYWRVWLHLMDLNPIGATSARQDIRKMMEVGEQAVDLILLAKSFNIQFDKEPLQEYLALRKQLGGFNAREQFAEFLLVEQSMTPREIVDYLQQHKKRLSEVISPDSITILRIEALAKDGQTETARSLLKEQAVSLGEDVSNRLTVLIDKHEGIDPRPQLESIYEETGELIDLKNLISHLKEVDDRIALLPLLKKLFKHEKSIENAHDYVACLSNAPHFNHAEIVKFLDEHPEIVEMSDDLISAKAWSLFHGGEYQKSKDINDSLLTRRTEQEDVALDINVAVAAGEWERFSTIVNREWQRRDLHTPEMLIGLAQLASQEDQNANRALQLSKLASEKAPDNPRILMAAYMLHCETGNEDKAAPYWLARAAEHSSPSEGPVWNVDLRYLVKELGPERQDRLRAIEKSLLDGDITIGMAASVFNSPLIGFFFQAARQNINEADGRSRTVLPIISGGHSLIDLNKSWSIGLDISSIIVLSYLGLLEKAIDAFHHVKLAPETMGLLFQERNRVRFHQPSRIKAAEEIRDLVNTSRLRTATDLPSPDQTIAEEVGFDLATLLQAAKDNDGRVICILPLNKVGSYMEKEANLGEYNDLIISTLDFCVLLHKEGKIATDICNHASAFLRFRKQAEYSSPPSAIFQRPIYLDTLALSYLHDAGLLQPSTTCDLDLWVHPRAVDENDALIRAGQIGTGLTDTIEEIRKTLRNAVESGKASFLPHVPGDTEQTEHQEIQVQTITSFIENCSDYDTLCVDDRLINSRSVVTDSTKNEKPIVCVLDLLRNLVSRQIISATHSWTLRHKLRHAGYVLIPIEADELEYWLKTAPFDDDELTESVELRILRQTLARIISLDMINLQNEAKFITDLTSTCGTAIRNLWGNDEITSTRAMNLSDWIWRHLMTPQRLAVRQPDEEVRDGWLTELMIRNLHQLLIPLMELPTARHTFYVDWIEHSILEPLRAANASLIERVVEINVNILKEIRDEQRNYGASLLQCIPKSLYQIIWDKEPQLARRFGHEIQEVIYFEGGRQFVIRDLFTSAKDVFSETRDVTNVEDADGREASITVDKENSQVVMEWTNEDSQPVKARIPPLTILSPNQDVRVKMLRKMTEEFGPTGPDFGSLLLEAEKRELNYDEFLSVFNEFVNGVTTIQRRMVGKINRREPFKIKDIVPHSLSYFEKFAGPFPGNKDTETYIREVLLPYRKSLLQRDLQAGLEFSLFGALRDDLMPGDWVAAIDNDALWKALSSCHAESNPFSLLGALDIALYRQDDDRFKEFAESAMIKLTNSKSGQTNGPDTYVLFALFADLILNRINFLKNGACQPGYWKLMCSWMQAGLITRAMADMNFENGVDSLQEWAHKNMTLAGACRTLIDARWEPVFWSRNTTSESLHGEIVRRLVYLKLRHEEAGRNIPGSEKIDDALMRLRERGVTFGTGPLEAHIRPSQSLPEDITAEIQDAYEKDSSRFPWPKLSVVSQFFMLGQTELEYVRQAIEDITLSEDAPSQEENLKNLACASVIAAINRNAALADIVAEKIVDLAGYTLQDEQIAMALMIITRTSTTFTDDVEWYDWIEDRLARIANCLPAGHSAQVFFDNCEAMDTVLPVNQSAHLRASVLASAGSA